MMQTCALNKIAKKIWHVSCVKGVFKFCCTFYIIFNTFDNTLLAQNLRMF